MNFLTIVSDYFWWIINEETRLVFGEYTLEELEEIFSIVQSYK